MESLLDRISAGAVFVLAFAAIAWASTPQVSVSSPGNNSSVTSPVHYLASASSSDCTRGIAAVRTYTAPAVRAYTVNANTLDVAISLAPGIYNTVVQAWDNCGGVGKTPVTIEVTGGEQFAPPRFL
jgi:phospholipase C